jgi:hypothetical protein
MRSAWLDNPQLRVRMWSVLAVAALLWMECTIMSLWYQALFQPEDVSLGAIFLILMAIFATSHLIPWVLETRHLPIILRQVIFVLWITLAAFASLKLLFYPLIPISLGDLLGLPLRYITHSDVGGANFYHPVIVILIAWRGVALARGTVTLTGVQNSFQVWLIFLLLYGMFFAPLHPGEATLGLYLFLFCGLVAMSAARVANLSGMRGGRLPRFGLGWMGSILLSGLVVVGLAILAGWLASGWVAQVVSFLVIVIFAALTALVLFILSPLLGVLAGLIPKIADLLFELLARLRGLQLGQQFEQLLEEMNSGLGRIAPYVLVARGLVLAGIVIVLVLLVLLALVLRKVRIEKDEVDEATPTTLGNRENRLRSLLRRLLEGARGLRLRSPGQLLAAARIRQIYRLLMLLSKKMGAERSPSVTPLEFLPTLAGLIPEESAGLGLITQAYLKIRYGEYPESRQEVQEVETAWGRVRRRAPGLIRMNKKKK